MTIKHVIFLEMIDYINSHDIHYFCDFLDYCDEHNKSWFEDLVDCPELSTLISNYFLSKFEKDSALLLN